MTLERGVRTFVGGLILSTGVMKLVVPSLRSAWGAQLKQANLPLRDVTYHILPIVEIGVGTTLIAGLSPKAGAVIVISMMAGATYNRVCRSAICSGGSSASRSSWISVRMTTWRLSRAVASSLLGVGICPTGQIRLPTVPSPQKRGH